MELDNGTESNNRFARDKVLPGIHLLHSELYQRELQAKSGRFLVVVKGSERRFNNMRAEVAQIGGSGYFLFTRAEWVKVETALLEPIWYLPHVEQPCSLEEYETSAFQAFLRETLKTQPVPQLLARP